MSLVDNQLSALFLFGGKSSWQIDRKSQYAPSLIIYLLVRRLPWPAPGAFFTRPLRATLTRAHSSPAAPPTEPPPPTGSKRTRVHSPPKGLSTQDTHTTTASFPYADISHQLFTSPPSSPSPYSVYSSPPSSPERSDSGDDDNIAMRK